MKSGCEYSQLPFALQSWRLVATQIIMNMTQTSQHKAKVAFTLGAIAVLFGIIIATFWYQDLRFMLPTAL